MADIPGRAAPDAVAGLQSRSAALRKAAANPRAADRALLDAALTELDAAIESLVAGNGAPAGKDANGAGGQPERRLLQAIFGQTPVPLLVVDGENIVRRANLAACELFGVGPGYATGRAIMSMIEPAGHAPLRSQLAAVRRTRAAASASCSLLAAGGEITCSVDIRMLEIRGDEDRLLLVLRAGEAPAAKRAPGGSKPGATRHGATKDSGGKQGGQGQASAGDPQIAAQIRRTDLLADTARLLLENAAASESVILQRCARLLAAELDAWVIVDVVRRGPLQRHFVAGPEDPASARLAQLVSAVAPGPGSAPHEAVESGSTRLVTHAEDDEALGRDGAGTPVLPQLGPSLLAVPVADGSRVLGALTLVRSAQAGYFGLPDAGLVEQIAGLLARAISARRLLTRQSETAAALRSSLLPPVLKAVPGVEIAAAHLAPTRGREVGGDFYDVYPTPDGWGVAIGDVCGKGDDAAAATAAARHAIRVLSHWNADPAQVLRGANEIMLTEEFGSRFVTADAAHLSWRDRRLRVVLASAGHPGPVLLKPDGWVQALAGGGVALGIFPDPEPATQELELESGDVLFFFTDGLTGARSPQQSYLEEILTDSLAGLAGRYAADIVSEMRKVVLDFSGGVLRDDLTMLALRAGEPPAT
jgi:serine phosphatase RsbU (regulator of sigma subunit)/PAS domain-containing protein